MAYIYRKLFLSCKQFKYDKAGFISTSQLHSKFFSILQNFESQFVLDSRQSKIPGDLIKKCSFVASDIQTQPKFVKSPKQEKFVPGSKFVKLNLPQLIANANKLPSSAITSVFSKIIIYYFIHKNQKGFDKYIKKFLEGWEFQTFCEVTENKLRTMQPSSFLGLLYLHHLNISPASPLMRKVLTLIMDNINYYNMFEIFHIYSKITEDIFNGCKESDELKKVCYVYFNEVLEEDLDHCWNTEDLIYYLQEDLLPDEIRLRIAKRVFEILKKRKLRRVMYKHFYKIIFQPPFYPLFKTETLESLKEAFCFIRTAGIWSCLLEVYEEVVRKNDEIYDGSLMEIFTNKFNKNEIVEFQIFVVVNNLSRLGYYEKKGLECFTEFIVTDNMLHRNTLEVAEICVRNCLQEGDFENWDKLKGVFDAFFTEANFHKEEEVLNWCEYLTFLQCDTRSLLSKIFNVANADSFLLNFERFRSLLRLHHLANKYFSSGYEKIKESRVKEILKLATQTDKQLGKYNVEEVLGGDKYLLTNCTTSNNHMLHMVAIFGSDNKPIDLSSYKTAETTANKGIVNIDNIEKPEGAKVVAFQEVEDYQPLFFRNQPDKMSGVAKLTLKSLEDCGCDLVLLTRNVLGYKPEKRLEFIQSQIDKILNKV